MARGRGWNDHEDALLTRFWRRNLTDRQIASYMPQRSFSAIRSRAHNLGLPPRENQNKGGKPRDDEFWTDERREFVRKQFVEEGKTDLEIAAMIGHDVTRNAVIGIRTRMGIKRGVGINRGFEEVNNQRRRRQELARKAGNPATPSTKIAHEAAVAIQESAAREVATAAGLVPLRDLDSNACHWPIGDPQQQPFGFCGAPKVPGLPYCKQHALKAYVDGDMAIRRAEKREQVKVRRVKEGV